MDPVIEVTVAPEAAPVVVAPVESVAAQAAEIVDTAKDLAKDLARSNDQTGDILEVIGGLRQVVLDSREEILRAFAELRADVQTLGTVAIVAATEPEPVSQVAEAAGEVAAAAVDVSTAAAEAVPEEAPTKRGDKKSSRKWL